MKGAKIWAIRGPKYMAIFGAEDEQQIIMTISSNAMREALSF
jgi:hypothetical protein